MTVAFLAALAFLSGSIASGVIVSRVVAGRDVRDVGSGNIGAANVVRAAGFGAGVMVAVLDMLKGLVPVLVGRLIGLDDAGLAVVAVAAVLGHDFSIFLRFRGGKGVATSLGVCLVLAPLATVLAMVVWLAALFALRYASLASLVAMAVLPLLIAGTHGPAVFVLASWVLFVLAAAKHWENIARLLNGTEPRFRQRPGTNA